jgi:hypothetical protein
VIWIAQCLCPARHCMMATAGEADSEAEAQAEVRQPLRRLVASLLLDGALNQWCGLCGAHRATWKYEVARSRYRTREEAVPELKRLEAEQALTRAVWGDTHLTTRPN